MKKKTTRDINGYNGIYLPEHPRAYTSENWVGWVYEHIVVAEQVIGRPLNDGEIVHHLDGNKKNNRPDNIIVLSGRRCHMALHHWIDSGAKMHESYQPKNSKYIGMDPPDCLVCGKQVANHNDKYCSIECAGKAARKAERPSESLLIMRLQNSSYLQVGKDYGVSDNAVRKWVRSYGYDPKTLEKISQTVPIHNSNQHLHNPQ